MIAGIIMEAGSTPGDGRGKARDVTRSMKSTWIFGPVREFEGPENDGDQS